MVVASPLSVQKGGSLSRPNLYYGWYITLTLAITELVSWGILYYAFSVLQKPLQLEMGWDTAAITGAFSLAILTAGFAAVPIGRWLDRYGPRLIMSLGSCAAVLLVLAWSQVQDLGSFYLLWFLIGICSAAVLYEPAFTVVANWFIQKRAKALTLLTFGGGLASVIFVPLTQWLISQYHWRMSLIILAVILGIITIPLHVLVLRRRPADIGRLPDGETPNLAQSHLANPGYGISTRVALRTSSFWLLTLAFSLSTFASIAVSVHLIPYLSEQGFSTVFAAGTLSLLGGSQIPGRLLFTPLGSRFSRRYLTAAMFSLQALAVLVLLAFPSETGILLFAFLFGSGAGASSPARAALLAEIYGSTHYGSISGIQAFLMTLARAAAPLGMAVLYLLFHNYLPMWWLLLLLSIGAVSSVLMLQTKHPQS